MKIEILKKLSANDVGLTGSHQAGILVPKEEQILTFFPLLTKLEKNPRVELIIHEPAKNARHAFNFIYYNNRLFGGTRNEYRLTCMTSFLRERSAKIGDELLFSKDENGSYQIEFRRASKFSNEYSDSGMLVLSGGWKIINTR